MHAVSLEAKNVALKELYNRVYFYFIADFIGTECDLTIEAYFRNKGAKEFIRSLKNLKNFRL